MLRDFTLLEQLARPPATLLQYVTNGSSGKQERRGYEEETVWRQSDWLGLGGGRGRQQTRRVGFKAEAKAGGKQGWTGTNKSLQQGRESGNPEVGQALYRDKIAANSISCHKGGSLNTLLDLCAHPNTRDIHACP